MKKVCGTILCMAMVFQNLMADEATDAKALEIRKAQAILKNKTRKVESVKEEMQNLNEDLVNSSVVDENTIKTSGTATTMMEKVSSVRLKKTNEELLKASITKGDDRKTSTKLAQTELGEAINELGQIRKLNTLKADKAKLSARLSEAVKSLSNVGEKLKEEVKKELAGEKPNQEKINELAEKQEKIADELKQLTEDVKDAAKKAENPEDKKELEKVAEALAGEKKPEDKAAQKPEDKNKANEAKPESAEKKAEEIAKKIENKELTEALKKEKDLIEKLDKAAKELANNAEKNDEPLTKEEQAEKDVEELAEALEKQNEDLEQIKEEHEGDENIQQDKEFNEALEKQNELKKAAKKAKEKLAGEPKPKAALEKAEKALDEAKKELEEGDLKEAMEKNEEAEKDIKEALDQLEKDSKSAKDKKKKEKGKKGEKGEKGEEEKDKKEGKPEEDPEMADVKLEFDDQQKAAEKALDMDMVHLRDNKVQLGDMPTAEAVWGTKAGEKDKKILMQSLRDKAPKEYDDLTRKYFEALASIGE